MMALCSITATKMVNMFSLLFCRPMARPLQEHTDKIRNMMKLCVMLDSPKIGFWILLTLLVQTTTVS